MSPPAHASRLALALCALSAFASRAARGDDQPDAAVEDQPTDAAAAPAHPTSHWPGQRADEPEIHVQSTTRESPEELPRNNPPGALMRALPAPVQRAAAQLAKAHTPSEASMTSSLETARSRMGSGTSWMPSSSPMYGLIARLGLGWRLMVRGNIFAGYDWFNSKRGGRSFVNTNSMMFVAWHSLWGGEIIPRLILSWEALSVPHGYPLLGQTGETIDGRNSHDRQPPHSLFSEIALLYSRPIRRDIALQLYLALAGEPALGPGSYAYRVSALSDPLAPISYSLQEAPLVSAGLVTLGVFSRKLKLEASLFNGRESHGPFWHLELDAPNSFATRLTYNPSPSWSAQTSYGFLQGSLSLDSHIAVHRWTTSVSYNRRLGSEENWATTLVVGAAVDENGPANNAALLETNWNFDGHQTLFGRCEYDVKTAARLAVEGVPERTRYRLGSLVLGYVYYFRPLLSLRPGLGVRGSITPLDAELSHLYGTRLPIGVMGYAQLRAAALAVRQ